MISNYRILNNKVYVLLDFLMSLNMKLTYSNGKSSRLRDEYFKKFTYYKDRKTKKQWVLYSSIPGTIKIDYEIAYTEKRLKFLITEK